MAKYGEGREKKWKGEENNSPSYYLIYKVENKGKRWVSCTTLSSYSFPSNLKGNKKRWALSPMKICSLHFPFPSLISFQANKGVFFSSFSSLSFLSFHPKIVTNYKDNNVLYSWKLYFIKSLGKHVLIIQFCPSKSGEIIRFLCWATSLVHNFTKNSNLFKIAESIVNFCLKSNIFHNFNVGSCLCISLKLMVKWNCKLRLFRFSHLSLNIVLAVNLLNNILLRTYYDLCLTCGHVLMLMVLIFLLMVLSLVTLVAKYMQR